MNRRRAERPDLRGLRITSRAPRMHADRRIRIVVRRPASSTERDQTEYLPQRRIAESEWSGCSLAMRVVARRSSTSVGRRLCRVDLSCAMAGIPVRAGQGRVPLGADPAFSAAVWGDRSHCWTRPSSWRSSCRAGRQTRIRLIASSAATNAVIGISERASAGARTGETFVTADYHCPAACPLALGALRSGWRASPRRQVGKQHAGLASASISAQAMAGIGLGRNVRRGAGARSSPDSEFRRLGC
jgi:hypothetical protein